MTHWLSGWLLDPQIAQAVLGRASGPVQMRDIGALVGTGMGLPGLAASGQAPVAAVKPGDHDRLAYFNSILGGPVTLGTDIIHGVSAELSEGPDWTFEDSPEATTIRAACREFFDRPLRFDPGRGRAFWGSTLARNWSSVSAKAGHPIAGSPDASRIEVISRKDVHSAYFRFEEATLRVPQFSGAMGPDMPREFHHTGDAALLLPYDPARDEVLVVEQFRMGPWGRGDGAPWKLEPVAGMVDAGEAPDAAVLREAREEAGLAVQELIAIPGGYPSPGGTTTYFHCFVGLCDLRGADGTIAGLATESEDIRSHVLPLDEALAMMDDGRIDVLPLTTMLLWLSRYRDRSGMRG